MGCEQHEVIALREGGRERERECVAVRGVYIGDVNRQWSILGLRVTGLIRARAPVSLLTSAILRLCVAHPQQLCRQGTPLCLQIRFKVDFWVCTLSNLSPWLLGTFFWWPQWLSLTLRSLCVHLCLCVCVCCVCVPPLVCLCHRRSTAPDPPPPPTTTTYPRVFVLRAGGRRGETVGLLEEKRSNRGVTKG